MAHLIIRASKGYRDKCEREQQQSAEQGQSSGVEAPNVPLGTNYKFWFLVSLHGIEIIGLGWLVWRLING